jgi:hypothetical protein
MQSVESILPNLLNASGRLSPILFSILDNIGSPTA